MLVPPCVCMCVHSGRRAVSERDLTDQTWIKVHGKACSNVYQSRPDQSPYVSSMFCPGRWHWNFPLHTQLSLTSSITPSPLLCHSTHHTTVVLHPTFQPLTVMAPPEPPPTTRLREMGMELGSDLHSKVGKVLGPDSCNHTWHLFLVPAMH